MKISLSGYNEAVATLICGENAKKGDIVKISENYTVAPCAAGNDFAGVILSASEGRAAVQLGGSVTLPYSGTAPALGYTAVSADGAGGIKADTAGRKMLIFAVDTDAKLADIIL